MKTRGKLSGVLLAVACLIFLLLPSTSPAVIDYVGSDNYCIVPPFIETPITPNLLMAMDNSASMFDLFWIAGSTTALPTYNCGGTVGTVGESFCFDNTYSNDTKYEGYFEKTSVYKYVETPADNASIPGANDRWQVSAMPNSCTYKNSTSPLYVCVDIAGLGTTASPYTTTNFYATGNFLNWLSASKFDIQKKILTGGKYDAASGLLTGESRGCVGRRFVKVDPTVAGITFAMRGPSSVEPDNVNPSTQGGLSRIEIYVGTNPNIQDCQCAIANWTTGNFGQAQTNSKNCLNIGAGTAAGNEIATFNHALGTCWSIKENIKKGNSLFGPPNTTDLTGACLNAYKDVCGGNLRKSGNDYYCTMGTADLSDDIQMFDNFGAIPGSAQLLTSKLTNDISGNWICTSYLNGVAPLTHNPVTAPYNTYDTGNPLIDNAGFLGRCVTNFTKQGQSLDFDWTTAAAQSCVMREILHFCYGAEVAEVTDPSEGAADTAETGNIPSVLMDSSVRSLGTPAGTFFIKVPATDPKGLIQEYKGTIRFGAMSFNQVGTTSECTMPGSNIKCPTAGANSDGAKVLVPVSNDPGDHSTAGSVIKAIDDLVAETWTPYSEAFYTAIGYYAQRPDIRINPADFSTATNPSQTQCQKNNILLISDGLSTADLNQDARNMASAYNAAVNLAYPANPSGVDIALNTACMKYAGSRNMDDIAWVAKNRNIYTLNKASDSGIAPTFEQQRIYTYVVYSGVSTAGAGECNPLTLMQNTALRGGGLFAQAKDPDQTRAAIRNMLETIKGRTSSGTAASVLASGEGSGANLLQAIFYPKKEFNGGVCSNNAATSCIADAGCVGGTCQKDITWSGTLHNLWYYIDPRLGSSTIRENTVADSAAEKLMKLDEDYIVNFAFDNTSKTAYARRFASNAAGVMGAEVLPPVSIDNLGYLWEAGRQLHGRDLATSPRTIWTQTNGTLTNFSALNTADATVQALLQAPGSSIDASRIIKYVSGYNKFCQNTATTCNIDADCVGVPCENIYRNRIVRQIYPGPQTITGTWKLGDVVNSTPKLVTWVPLNAYDRDYHDSTYTEFLNSAYYKNRGKVIGGSHFGSGMVFAGANDGMLHAFKLGALKVVNDGTSIKASIIGDSADDLGKEAWAFIPKNALPYLKYLLDPNYKHLYYVDATPYLFDASIACSSGTDYWNCDKNVNSWRTILIGGMRFGGASKSAASTYGVPNPVPDQGFSSYFALDITTPANPTLLWEFTHPDLGFATSGPAIARISARDASGVADNNKNGKWFVVFASGPTGPIDTVNRQFKGFSDQELKLFIFDVASGPGANNINVVTKSTGILNAFGGSMNNATIDYDLDYQDDALYVGYTKSEVVTPDATTRWTEGGVIRLITREDTVSGAALNPGNWEVSKVIDNIGPVTSAVSHLAHYPLNASKPDKAWLYFGTGRYFYKTLDGVDDPTIQRKLYGIVEPCLTDILANNNCMSMSAGLFDATSTIPTADAAKKGWFINLDPAGGTNMSERVITDTLASPTGAIFFTTFSPSANACDFGGTTHLWATKYDTGGSVASSLRGKAMLQVSTGEIKEIDLSQAFKTSADNPDSKLERRSADMPGVPPAGQGLTIVVPPKAINKIMHLRKQ